MLQTDVVVAERIVQQFYSSAATGMRMSYPNSSVPLAATIASPAVTLPSSFTTAGGRALPCPAEPCVQIAPEACHSLDCHAQLAAPPMPPPCFQTGSGRRLPFACSPADRPQSKFEFSDSEGDLAGARSGPRPVQTSDMAAFEFEDASNEGVLPDPSVDQPPAFSGFQPASTAATPMGRQDSHDAQAKLAAFIADMECSQSDNITTNNAVPSDRKTYAGSLFSNAHSRLPLAGPTAGSAIPETPQPRSVLSAFSSANAQLQAQHTPAQQQPRGGIVFATAATPLVGGTGRFGTPKPFKAVTPRHGFTPVAEAVTATKSRQFKAPGPLRGTPTAAVSPATPATVSM